MISNRIVVPFVIAISFLASFGNAGRSDAQKYLRSRELKGKPEAEPEADPQYPGDTIFGDRGCKTACGQTLSGNIESTICGDDTFPICHWASDKKSFTKCVNSESWEGGHGSGHGQNCDTCGPCDDFDGTFEDDAAEDEPAAENQGVDGSGNSQGTENEEEPAQEEPAAEESAQEDPSSKNQGVDGSGNSQGNESEEEPAQEDSAEEEPAQEDPASENQGVDGSGNSQGTENEEEPAQEEPAAEEPAQEDPSSKSQGVDGSGNSQGTDTEDSPQPEDPVDSTNGVDGSGNSNGSGLEESESGGGYGDPHIKSWLGHTFDFHGGCDLVLAQSEKFNNDQGFSLHVRTTIRRDWSFISTASLKIGEDTFQVGTRGIYYQNNKTGPKMVGSMSLPRTIAGYPIVYTYFDAKRHKYEVDMGEKGTVSFKVYNEFLAISINNVHEDDFGESVGLMGQYHTGKLLMRDGTEATNMEDYGKDWQVHNTEPMLFHTVEGPQHPVNECKMPPPTKAIKRRLAESMVSFEDAEKACQDWNEEARESCIYDVLATGDLDMAAAGAF